MKYLQTFEALRKDTKSLNLDFDKLFKEISIHCKNFSWDDTPILRSVPDLPKDFLIVDPKKLKRKSSSNKNWYTLIMDNSEKWKKYPKRSESLICSIEDPLWDKSVFRVIPFDNSKWGVCSQNDMWISLPYAKERYKITAYNFIDFLGDLNEIIYKNNNIPDNDYDFFKEHIMELEMRIKQNKNIINKNMTIIYKESLYILFTEYFDKNLSMFDYFEDVFDPIKNKFELLNYDEVVNMEVNIPSVHGKEIWTDSKCILVPENYLDEKYKLK